GLTPHFIQYNAAFNASPAQVSGNGFLYSIAPILTVTGLTGTVSKTYDGTTAATLEGSNIAATGLLNGNKIASASGTYAIADAGIEPSDIDCVIVATISHLMQTPAAATTISDELGCGAAAAFDVSAACAGFCYALSLASDMVRVGTSANTLVIGVERLSKITNPDDRSTAFIFADGAGAVVVGPSDEPRIGPVVWGADGSKHDLITQTKTWDEMFDEGGKEWPTLHMEGSPVFRWASFEMARTAREALDRAGVDAADLDVFVPHQANMRITDAMARTLKLSDRVAIVRDIAEQGNTSAESIPLALERMITDGEAKSGQSALFIAFGAGLAYAAQVVVLP
ncbi:MAG: beta-ketoacyl-ACP synthase 3, partial [Actinomycetia bacterium]|nr:beta-ketoacyl-ACP synthase 3 [Actinomycetes bacterium]